MGEVSLLQMRKEEKLGRIDIKAELNDSKIVDIEMQVKNEHDMKKRDLFYAARLITGNIGNADGYLSIKPVIIINILNYNLLEVPEYYTKTVTVAEKHRDYVIMDGMTYYFIELPKFRESKPKLVNMLECWLALIDGEDGGLKEMAETKNKIIKEANNEVEEILSDEDMKALIEFRKSATWDRNSMIEYARRQGLKKGTEKGRAEGIEEGKIEIAKKLIKMQLSDEQISKITGLKIDEILKLKKK